MKRKCLFMVGCLVLIVAVFFLAGACTQAPQQMPTVKWAFQAGDLRTHWDWPAQQAMVDNIGKRTNGKFQITIYDMSELALDPSQWANALKDGAVQLSVVSPSQHASTIPALGVHTLPFLHVWPDDFYKTGYAIMPNVAKILKKIGPITPIEFFIIDPAALWTIAPVSNVTNIGKLRIRSWDEASSNGVSAMGGEPILMAFSEVYPSLQRGVVDGVLTGPGAIIMGSLWDYIKHGYLVGFPGNIYYLVYNDAAFKALPNNYQTILLEEAALMAKTQQKNALSAVKDSFDKIAAKGVTIHEVAPADIRVIGDKLKPSWQKWADRVGPDGKELLDAVLKTLGK